MPAVCKKIKIALFDFPGHSFPYELSCKLSEMGYEMHHLFCPQESGPKSSFNLKVNCFIHAVLASKLLPKNNPIKRMFWELSFSLKLLKSIKKINPDRIIFTNTPPLILLVCTLFLKAEWTWWVQDIFSFAAKKLKVLTPAFRRIAEYIFKRIESRLAKNATAIVVISEDFLDFFSSSIRHKISIIENWAPSVSLVGSQKREIVNDYLIYAGTIGFKHDPGKLIEIIERTIEAGLDFCLVSEGSSSEFIKRRFKNNGNFHGYNFLSENRLSNFLLNARGAVYMLEPEANSVAVPSKVYTYLRNLLPVFGVCAPSNLSARLVIKNDFGTINDFASYLEKIASIDWQDKFKTKCHLYNLNEQNVEIKANQFRKILDV
jgi:hypothetical protein